MRQILPHFSRNFAKFAKVVNLINNASYRLDASRERALFSQKKMEFRVYLLLLRKKSVSMALSLIFNLKLWPKEVQMSNISERCIFFNLWLSIFISFDSKRFRIELIALIHCAILQCKSFFHLIFEKNKWECVTTGQAQK